MSVAFGGMRSPSSEALAISAQAWPIGYPPCLRRGNMMAPMQESVAQAAPQMEPNTAQEMTATMPSPPRICPTNTSTMSISFSAMRPRSMMPPARMNIAIAISETEFICSCVAGYPAPFAPPKKISHAQEDMKLTGTGTPIARQNISITSAT